MMLVYATIQIDIEMQIIIKEKMVYLYTNSISVHVTNVECNIYINNIKI